MTINLLTEHHLEFLRLTGGCTGSPESTLVKMSHCWKSRVTTHLYMDLAGKSQVFILFSIDIMPFQSNIPS